MSTVQLTDEERIQAIEDLPFTGESKFIHYNDTNTLYSVKEIPLEYLLYNPHNGRIRSLTLSYESQYSQLNPKNADDKAVIEQFLYDSAKSRNEKTIESIEKVGQKEIGIVTRDGVIIDGNRRAMIINLLNKKDNEKRTFKAIVLEDNLVDKREEIMSLETSYQMGVDSKVDYNPIEKYIRCRELKEFYTIDEIAEKMAEAPNKISEWLNTIDLMDQYLIFLKTPKMYTRLDKREGHFVDLRKYLRTYENSYSSQLVDWEYTPEDVREMKNAYFTYIRLGIPVARSRVIGRATSQKSFFCYKDIWLDFKSELENINKSFQEEEFSELKRRFPEENHDVLIEKMDTKWKESIEDQLDDILIDSEALLIDKQKRLAPLRLLRRAKNIIYQIDQHTLVQEMNFETQRYISEIDERVQTFKGLF